MPATGASGSSVVVEPPMPPRHRYQASNSQAATACERVQLGFAAARACRRATSWIMRTVLSRIRSGSTHRLEIPCQRELVRHPDPGRGCSLPTARCGIASILWLVARSSIYRGPRCRSQQGLIIVLVPCAAAGQMPCAWFDVAGQGLASVARQGFAAEHKKLCHVVRRWRWRR